MKALDLQREIVDADRLSERGRLILQLNEQVLSLQSENKELKQRIEALTQEKEPTNVN